MTTADRRQALVDHHTINGVDFVEVDATTPTNLIVHFVFNLFTAPAADPAHAIPTLPPNASNTVPLAGANFTVTGGERITSFSIGTVVQTPGTYNQLTVPVSPEGDFSLYTLTLVNAPPGPGEAPAPGVPAGFDPQSASAQFLFHIDCANDFDCAPSGVCPPEVPDPPAINYLAKDYPGFRQVMLDRMSLLAPTWQEANAADLGVALVETLAYVADHLSYRQDVVATEAYLGTARLRSSVRRHARLVDYYVSEGCNARAWLRVTVTTAGTVLPASTTCATSVPGAAPPLLAHTTLSYTQAINAGAVFFSTMADSPPLYPAHAVLPLYPWSNTTSYCLPAGATSATLQGTLGDLTPGMVLILAEVLGPNSGSPADADPAKRQAVRLVSVTPGTDPLDGTALTEITWDPADALGFPLCLSSTKDAEHGGGQVAGVSVAWGNIVLADQGRWVGTPSDPLLAGPERIGTVPAAGRFRPSLASSPLTFAAPAPPATGPASAAVAAPGTLPVAAISLVGSDEPTAPWTPVADLFGTAAHPTSRSFLPEIEADGTAYLLFGDGITTGLTPEPGARFAATYRVGNGTAGNVARDSVVLIDATVAGITAVTNPLPAWGGVDPETVDHVRQSAPVAFQTQKRAVTPADYVAVATRYPGVQRAAATLRWTGSWTTVFLTIERDAEAALDTAFIDNLTSFVDGYRMAGFDLQVEVGTMVPLHIAMKVCVQPGYVAADVEQVLLGIFSGGALPDGSPALFNPTLLDLGEPFYLSPLVAAAQAVEGVDSVTITAFERQNAPGGTGLVAGVLIPQPLEFFVLDNDPNFPERGLFELSVGGGL